MISLKTRIITFITASTLLLCACGKSEPSTPPPATPKEAAECVLESIKKLDMETLNQYTDKVNNPHFKWGFTFLPLRGLLLVPPEAGFRSTIISGCPPM